MLPLAADRQLRPHALLDLALTLDRHASAEVIYSDEDRLDAAGRRSDPRFKPAWSPELLDDRDYFGDLTLLRARDTPQPRRLARAKHVRRTSTTCCAVLAAEAAPETIVHLAKVLVHGTAGPAAVAPRRGAAAPGLASTRAARVADHPDARQRRAAGGLRPLDPRAHALSGL